MRARFDREFLKDLEAMNVPAQVIEICRKATHFDPTKRYATAKEMARDIRAVAQALIEQCVNLSGRELTVMRTHRSAHRRNAPQF